MSFRELFLEALNGCALSPRQRKIIENRYVTSVEKMISDHQWVAIKYNSLMLTVSISTVLVTALISLEKIVGLSVSSRSAIFWVALVASFLGTIANKLLYFTGVNKQYVLESISASKIQSEGWMYVSGSGKYNSRYMNPDEKFDLFMTSVEKLISSTDKGVAVSAGKGSSSIGLGGSGYIGQNHSLDYLEGGHSDDLIIEINDSSTDSLYKTHHRKKSSKKKKRQKAQENTRSHDSTEPPLHELFHSAAPPKNIFTGFTHNDESIIADDTPEEIIEVGLAADKPADIIPVKDKQPIPMIRK